MARRRSVLLSLGIHFLWLYADRLRAGRVGGRAFFIARFSRLYPLHLATLVVVAAGQALYARQIGATFVYAHNDPSQFIVHLLFASGWGYQATPSFNAPVWSVSVEVFLYATFYFACRTLRVTPWIPVVVVGFAAYHLFDNAIGRGLASFYLGAAVHRVYLHVVARGSATRATSVALPVALAAWAVVVAAVTTEWFEPASRGAFVDWFATLAVFPATVLALALAETRWPGWGRSLRMLGDASYGIYMLHFPLQLGIAIVFSAAHVRTTVFDSPLALATFIGVLVVLSVASHRWFERPLQDAIRARFDRPRP